MALSLNPPAPIQAALTRVAELRRELARADDAFALLVSRDADLTAVVDTQIQIRKALAAAEEDAKKLAREGKCSASAAGVSVSYSNPTRSTYDWRVLATHPGFWDLPGIIQEVTFNPEGLAAAAAAGMLPEELLAKAKREVPSTKDGRVALK